MLQLWRVEEESLAASYDCDELLARFAEGWPKALDVSPGWLGLLLQLHRDLLAVAPSYQLYQVKEKFGGLRVYGAPGVDGDGGQFTRLIAEAEGRASSTCEICGMKGSVVRKGHYLRTLCVHHCSARGFSSK